MNLICNCPVDTFLSHVRDEKLENPFAWSNIKNEENYVNFIKNYQNIDFNNFEIVENKRKETSELKNYPLYSIIIDGKYKFSYTFVLLSPEEAKTRKQGAYVYTPKPKAYLKNLYSKKIQEMKNSDPIFIIRPFENGMYLDNNMEMIAKMDTPYMRILITTNEEISKLANGKVKVLVVDSYDVTNASLAIELADKIFN